jgi:hypothetical protein
MMALSYTDRSAYTEGGRVDVDTKYEDDYDLWDEE